MSSKILIALVILVHLAGLVLAAGPAVPPPSASAELTELDGDLRRILQRVGRDAEEGFTSPHLDEEVRVLRHRLDALESALHGAAAGTLAGKAAALRRLLGNLERAAEAGGHPAARPAHARRDPGVRTALAPYGTTLAPTNDFCAHALPIASGTVTGNLAGATNDGAASCGASLESPDAWFRYDATEDGWVSVDTFGSAYDTVVSVHRDCPGTISNERACNDDAYGLTSAVSFQANSGASYWIRLSGVNGAVGSFTLHAGTGGGIGGTVTEDGTGTPVANATVDVWDQDGYFVQSATTVTDGTYSTGGLRPDTYFVATDAPLHLDELYAGLPCDGGCDKTTGTAILVNSSTTKGGVDFALQRGGSIAGTVTDNGSGEPAGGVRVKVYDSLGNWVGDNVTGLDGTYAVGGLDGGSYYVVVQTGAYADELYDDIPCPGSTPSGCSPTSGTSIPVVLGAETGGIDFGLDRLGVIRGVVTAEGTGEPLADVEVLIYDNIRRVREVAYTEADGSYETIGLVADTYFATAMSSQIVSELYQDLPCVSFCDVTAGTPIPVALGTDATVDFVVNVHGRVSGTVISASTGLPVNGAYVLLRDSTGGRVRSDYTETDGTYRFTSPSPGTYYVSTNLNDYLGFFDEIYDNGPCPNPNGDCDVSGGTPIAIALDSHAQDVDFALDSRGTITVTVTDEVTGDPIADAHVVVYDSYGSSVDDDYTGNQGQASFRNLDVGTYYVRVRSGAYVGEVWDGLSCEVSCPVLSGTPIVLDTNVDAVLGVALGRKGSIVGRVTDAGTGLPLADYRVEAYNASGNYVQSNTTNVAGEYEIVNLMAGTYYVRTAESGIHQNEIYADIPCVGSCDPTTGVPINVVLGATVTADLALERLGAVSGVVTEVTGAGVRANIRLWREGGGYNTFWSNPVGVFEIHGILPGRYYLSVHSDNHLDELYPGLPCEPTCDPTAGTPVDVAFNTTVTGLDVVLDVLGEISGTVRNAVTGDPIRGLQVEVWTADGSYVDTVSTDDFGLYLARGLATGSHVVLTNAYTTYVNEVYDNVACPADGCVPSSGSPVTTGVNTRVTGIDFNLDQRGSITGTVTATTGDVAPYVRVEVWDEFGSSVVASGSTGAEGHYEIDELMPGNYRVATDDDEYVNEVFDNLPCPDSVCDPASGSSVAVSVNATTSGIDFVLDRLGTFAGTVTSEETGEPLYGINVSVWSSSDWPLGSVRTDADGRYEIFGFEPGTYYLAASHYTVIGELHADIPCPNKPPWGCDPTKGTPVTTGGVLDVTAVDFSLRASDVTLYDLFGQVRGPAYASLEGVVVDVWDTAGELVNGNVTDTYGRFSVRVEPGTYYLSTHNDQGYLDEVYFDVVCVDGSAFAGTCDPAQGLPITVAGSNIGGLNFQLSPLPPIFTDGFESGGVTRWSRAVGVR